MLRRLVEKKEKKKVLLLHTVVSSFTPFYIIYCISNSLYTLHFIERERERALTKEEMGHQPLQFIFLSPPPLTAYPWKKGLICKRRKREPFFAQNDKEINKPIWEFFFTLPLIPFQFFKLKTTDFTPKITLTFGF